MKAWLKDRGYRDLIADLAISRLGGQHCIGYGHPGWVGVENLCMGAVGHLVVVKPRESIQMDGLTQGQAKLLPLVFGLKKLHIRCLLDKSKIAVTCLEEKIAEVDEVQSVEIITIVFNK